MTGSISMGRLRVVAFGNHGNFSSRGCTLKNMEVVNKVDICHAGKSQREGMEIICFRASKVVVFFHSFTNSGNRLELISREAYS